MKVSVFCLNLFVFLSILSLTNASSCPCEQGLNNLIKISEKWVLMLNRAIKSFTSSTNYYFFTEFLQSFREILIEIQDVPYGLGGTIANSTGFKDFVSNYTSLVETLQTDINGGDDLGLLQSLTNFFNGILDALELITFIVDKEGNEYVQKLDQTVVEFGVGQVEVALQALSELPTSIGDALYNFVKNYRKVAVSYLQGSRKSCECLVPNCEN